MKWLLLFFISFFTSITIAQNKRIKKTYQKELDSVIKISEAKTNAEEKINTLCGYVSSTRYTKDMKVLIELSEKIARTSNQDDLLATSYYYTANYYYYNAQLDSALIYVNKSRPLINDQKQPLLRSFLTETESGIYRMQGNNPLAIATLIKSKSLLDKVDTLKLNDLEKGRYRNTVLSSINSLANYYNSIEEYEKAESYYNQGYNSSIQNKLNTPAGVFMTNKGDLYLNTKQYDKALIAFEEGKKLKILGKAPQRMIANSDLNLGIAHTQLGNYALAENILTETIAFYKEQENHVKLGQAYSYRGELYIKKNSFNQAIKDCENGKNLSQKTNTLELLPQACNCLYTSYKALGKIELALSNYEQFVRANDSIFNEKNIKKQTEQELQYEFSKTEELKNAEIAARKNQSLLYSILAIIGFLFAAFLGFFFYKNRKKNILLAKQKKLLEATVDEKNILLRETHHRVKNSFQMVSSLLFIQSETSQNNEAKLAIKEAQNRVRSMVLIHQKLYSKDQLVGIDAQEYIEDFTKDIIESHQFETTKLNYEINAEKLILSIETITPLGLILNELITNVLKHAFKPVTKNSLLQINFFRNNDALILEVIDNGVGMPTSIKETSFGIELIDALSKKLKAKRSHKTRSPKGTVASVVIKRFEVL
ncbi:Signal transduction histidine kinase [unidentified eubacterium SCB49]|nr:Signal transduction histidine kinase [unidentified eubacterium SCB49]